MDLRCLAAVVLVAASACSNHKPGASSCDGGAPCAGTTLVWLAPTTNADGTPLTDLAGYRLHFDTRGRGSDPSYAYATTLDLGMPACTALGDGGTECQFDLAGLTQAPATSYYVTVSAYDRAAPPNRSAYANEVHVVK